MAWIGTFRNDYNNYGFIVAHKEFNALRTKDWKIHKQEPTRDRKGVWNMYIDLYVSYCKIVEKFGIIFDEMAHVQRRQAVQKIFDSLNIRLLEIKNIIKGFDLCELTYLDDVLITRKFIPQDIDIIIPGHISHSSRSEYIQELIEKINQGERIYTPPVEEVEEEVVEVVVEQPKKRMILEDDEEEEEIKEKPVLLPHENPHLSEAKRAELYKIYLFNKLIESLQTCERARTDRIVFNDRLKQKELHKSGKRHPKPPSLRRQNSAAVIIQKWWRGFITRKYHKFEEIERKLEIGMLVPSWRDPQIKQKLEAAQNRKRQTRHRYEGDLEEFARKEEVRLLAVREASLFEDITDEIREWFHVWYTKTGNFDLFPEAEDGGTILVVTGQTTSIQEWEIADAHRQFLAERYAANPELKKKDAEEEKAKKAAEKERIKAEKQRLKEEAEAELLDPNPKWKYEISEGLVEMRQANWNYQNIWGFDNPNDNPEDLFVQDLVTQERLQALSLEVRSQVDEIMRSELLILRDALNRDRIKEGFAPLAPPKPPKDKKKKKKKAPKDPTGDCTIEELFQELVDLEIIHSYPKVTLDDFIGDYCYAGWDLRDRVLDPAPCLRDAIHSVIVYCILPFGSTDAPRPKGVLIAGPPGNGKKVLANAILNHTGAVLFDLTPANTVGKYPGAQGLKRLVHLVSKMSKILQPSIIFMNGGEKPFYAKVPPEESKNDPKLLKGTLFKGIVKNFKKDEKVFLLATSREPWNAAQGPFLKCYDTIINVPRLEYGSCVKMWEKKLMRFNWVPRDFDYSSLAMVTQGYSFKYLMECLDRIMTPERIIRLQFEPLTPEEVLRVVLAEGGVQMKKEDYLTTFIKWYNATPLAKKRQSRMADLQKELALLAKMAANAAKKK